MSSPRAIACHASACRPSRADRSAGGSAASSPSVFSPQRLNAAIADALERLTLGLAACRAQLRRPMFDALFEDPDRHRRQRRRFFARVGTTVSPGRASARTSAAMRVPATATCTRMPRAAASRRSSSPIVRGRTEQPLEPADVDRHEIVAVPLVARRELLGDRRRATARRSAARAESPRRRTLQARVQGSGISAEG